MKARRAGILGEFVQIKPPKREAQQHLQADQPVSFVPMEDLGVLQRRLAPKHQRPLSEVYGSYTYFAENDVLLAKITPCFENGKMSVAKGLANGVGFGSSEFMVLRCAPELLPEYLFYFLSRDEVRKDGRGRMTGAVGHKRVPPEFLQSLNISLPPLEEQKRIVAILDEAFEGLDRARANAEANLRSARELFDATIEGALQKVGGTSTTLAELLDRKWIVSHLDGNHGSSYPRKEEFVSEGVPYISANCIDGDTIDMSRSKYLTPQRADTLRKGVAQNRDVIFAHNATVGPVALLTTAERRVILSTSLTYYRCDEAHISPEFLVAEMRSAGFKRQYEAVMEQATRNQVPISMQRTFEHIIPSMGDQLRIADIAVQTERDIGELEKKFIQKLKDIANLRQALLQKAFAGELTSPELNPVRHSANDNMLISARILALGYSRHQTADREKTYGHVKAQKLLHLAEAVCGFDLGRVPIKDVAGPNDMPHMRRVEDWAEANQVFKFQRRPSGGYTFVPLEAFSQALRNLQAVPEGRVRHLVEIVDLLVPMDSEEAEVLVTVHAAWSNLIKDGIRITDELIVTAAREDWHPEKMKIARFKFFDAIRMIKAVSMEPDGTAQYVGTKQVRLL